MSTTTLGQNGSESNGNEGVFYIPESFASGASPLDGLVSYPGHTLQERSLTPLYRCSWCILQPQPIG